MKSKTKKTSGFTLLEIIIVIIIVAVLASLALPKLFSTVEFSRSSEAMSNMSSVRSSISRCYLQVSDYDGCEDFDDLDMDDPNTAPNNHFTYTIASLGATTGFRITATRNTLDNAAMTSSDWVRLIQDDSAGTVTKQGNTVYKSIK